MRSWDTKQEDGSAKIPFVPPFWWVRLVQPDPVPTGGSSSSSSIKPKDNTNMIITTMCVDSKFILQEDKDKMHDAITVHVPVMTNTKKLNKGDELVCVFQPIHELEKKRKAFESLNRHTHTGLKRAFESVADSDSD